jgi:hypothetical protein
MILSIRILTVLVLVTLALLFSSQVLIIREISKVVGIVFIDIVVVFVLLLLQVL